MSRNRFCYTPSWIPCTPLLGVPPMLPSRPTAVVSSSGVLKLLDAGPLAALVAPEPRQVVGGFPEVPGASGVLAF